MSQRLESPLRCCKNSIEYLLCLGTEGDVTRSHSIFVFCIRLFFRNMCPYTLGDTAREDYVVLSGLGRSNSP